jgi:hypothetical protein
LIFALIQIKALKSFFTIILWILCLHDSTTISAKSVGHADAFSIRVNDEADDLCDNDVLI